VHGLSQDGSCPGKYSHLDNETHVKACSDGKTNVKWCSGGGLHSVNLIEKIKGVSGTTVGFAMHKSWKCFHDEESAQNKCYEACAQDDDFKVHGLSQDGSCPGKYSHLDNETHVKACSDGKTNVKWCSGGGLHSVDLIEKIKGVSGTTVGGVQVMGKYCTADSDCDTGGYCQTYKTPVDVYMCHGAEASNDYCTGDADCAGSYCQNGESKTPIKAYNCHN